MQRVYRSMVYALAFITTVVCASASQASETAEYTLPNGLQVILQENHASPMIASVVLVRSGSKYEDAENNGVTHFLEHLLFNGTATRTQVQIKNRIDNLGGYINAFTRKEVTGYLSLVPCEHIAEALDIQQDMLFNSTLPEDKFPKERKIVIEEIRKDSDSPDYQAEVFHDQWAYAGSPYARTVLGTEELIATIPRESVLQYYQDFYQPNNMTLFVTGDFESVDMRGLIERTFGAHMARRLPERKPIVVQPLTHSVVKQTYTDVGETRIDIHFRLPAFSDPSYPALALLAELLNDDATSPLQRELTDGPNPLATTVSASLETQAEFSALRVSATTTDAKQAEEIVATVATVMGELSALPIDESVISRLSNKLRIEDIFLREKLHYYAMMNASLLGIAGHGFVDRLPDRIAKLTSQDLAQAARRHITSDRYIATIVRHRDTLASDAQAITVPDSTAFSKRTFANGMTVVVKSNPDSRVFAINILTRHRAALESDGMEGISDFVNRMLVCGTETRSRKVIDEQLSEIGAELITNDNPYVPYDDHYTTPQYCFIKFATIDDYAEKGASLLADLIGRPTFPVEELENAKKQVAALQGSAAGSPNQMARQLYYTALFQDGPYARPILGTPESVQNFTRESLRMHWAKLYAPSNVILTCVSGMPADAVWPILEATFGRIPSSDPLELIVPSPLQLSSKQSEHQSMQKEQVYIYLGNALVGASSADMPALMVANSILSSRLGDELREKQGLAYSVGSSIQFDREFGWFTCKMGTGKTNFKQAKAGIVSEIKRLQTDPVLPDEVATAQNKLWGSSLTARLARTNQAFYMGVDEYLGLGYDFSDRMINAIRAVSPADVQRVARQHFHIDQYVLATAGNVEQ